MYREFIIFAGIVVVSLFMTIHSHNKQAMRDSEIKLSEQRSSQENLLMQEGDLIKLFALANSHNTLVFLGGRGFGRVRLPEDVPYAFLSTFRELAEK